jgi:NADPH:quinone reductase-like Zn-dependent oxidoreductase
VSLNYRDLLILNGDHFAAGAGALMPVSDAVGEGVTRFAGGERVINAFRPDWIAGRMPDTTVGYGNGRDGWLAEHRAVPEHALVGFVARSPSNRSSTAFTRSRTPERRSSVSRAGRNFGKVVIVAA